MKLSQLIAGAVLSVSLTLTGCSAVSALSAASSLVGSKPDMTAQVGAENTKQGIGLNAKQSEDTKVGDVSGNAKVDTAKQGKGSTTVKDVAGDSVVNSTQQGIGGTTVKDVDGPVNASKQEQQLTNGNVQAKTVNITQSDSRPLLWAFGIFLGPVVVLVGWLLRRLTKKEDSDGDGTTQSGDTNSSKS